MAYSMLEEAPLTGTLIMKINRLVITFTYPQENMTLDSNAMMLLVRKKSLSVCMDLLLEILQMMMKRIQCGTFSETSLRIRTQDTLRPEAVSIFRTGMSMMTVILREKLESDTELDSSRTACNSSSPLQDLRCSTIFSHIPCKDTCIKKSITSLWEHLKTSSMEIAKLFQQTRCLTFSFSMRM